MTTHNFNILNGFIILMVISACSLKTKNHEVTPRSSSAVEKEDKRQQDAIPEKQRESQVDTTTKVDPKALFLNEDEKATADKDEVWSAKSNNRGNPLEVKGCKVWKIIIAHKTTLGWASGNRNDCAEACNSVARFYKTLIDKKSSIDGMPFEYICRAIL
ncbi:MAG: hypothetical protein R3B45_13800 [Bdellovibrionota bacterium]